MKRGEEEVVRRGEEEGEDERKRGGRGRVEVEDEGKS